MVEERSLFARIKEVDPEAFEAYLELIADKEVSKRCNLDMSAKTLEAAFVWKDANKTEFFWEKLARKLGERPTPVFAHPCDKFKKSRADYG